MVKIKTHSAAKLRLDHSIHIFKIVICNLAMMASIPAHAQLFQNITIGDPKALALGNAVTADPPGIDSIHYNPAGLAKVKGNQRNYKFLTGQMAIESRTGAQAHSPAVREAYEQTYPGQSFPIDDQANRHAVATTPMVMLPLEGLTETPVMAALLGGISKEFAELGITVGNMIYTPAAMGFKRDRDNDPGAYQGYEVGLTRLTYLSPTLGIKINDEWMVGFGVGASWQGFGVKTKFRSPEQTMIFIDGMAAQFNQNGLDLAVLSAFDNVGDLSIEMDDPFSPSFNLGVLYEPTPWLAFGFVYQSEAEANMKGDYVMKYSDIFLGTLQGLQPISGAFSLLQGAPFEAVPLQKGHVEMQQFLPAHMALGTSVKLFPNLKINTDVKWTQDSKWDVLTFEYDRNVDFLSLTSMVAFIAGGYGVEDNADPTVLRLPRHYRDVLSYAIGVEYQWNNALALRVGYEPRGSAVPEDRVDFQVPMADAYLYSFGFSYRVDKVSQWQAAFGYLVSKFNADIHYEYNDKGELINVIGESRNANDTRPGQVVYNPYAYLPIAGSTQAYLLAISYEQRY